MSTSRHAVETNSAPPAVVTLLDVVKLNHPEAELHYHGASPEVFHIGDGTGQLNLWLEHRGEEWLGEADGVPALTEPVRRGTLRAAALAMAASIAAAYMELGQMAAQLLADVSGAVPLMWG